MNYYPFHIGDYVSATRHLTWDEDAAYRRLLDVYYSTEKPLPLDPRAVYRLVVASSPEQRAAVDTVLSEFFVQTPNGWINVRADAEIKAMREKQDAQREKANKRWNKQRTSSGNATAMPRHSDSDAAASKPHAGAMPPTPTPTPTPIHSVPNGTGSAEAPPSDPDDPSATRTGAPDGPVCEAGTSPDPPPPPHADPPTDPVKALFDLGLAVLRGSGSSDRTARSLVGKLRKAVGDGDAMSILVSAKDKTDPAAYIAAAMKPDPVADAIRRQMGGAFVERLGDGRYRCGGRVFNDDGSRRVALC